MFDLLVIGGGPAGYLGAERAQQAGLNTALIEMNKLGGVCLNEGCIPSKALLHSAKLYESALHGQAYGVHAENVRLNHAAVIKRRGKVVRTLVAGVAAKMKGAGVTVIEGRAAIEERTKDGFRVSVNGEIIEARRLLIATGSSPVVPPIPGLREGLQTGRVITNREILTLDQVPGTLTIIGGGVIGLEMAAYYAAAGSHVTVIEMLDHIAGPVDREIGDLLLKEYTAKGVEFLLNTKVTGVDEGGVLCETAEGEKRVAGEKILLSIGRRANIEALGLERIGVMTTRAGIVTDPQMRTNVEGVYVAGDVNGRHMLAHTAYRESEVAVNAMLKKKDTMRYAANPSVIYTKPEVASVGFTEESAKEAGVPYEVKKLSMRYAGRFVAEHEREDGLCKVLVHAEHRNVIGVHLIGPYASEIIWGAAEMVELELRVNDAREIIFPHPTVSEIIREVLWEFDDQ